VQPLLVNRTSAFVRAGGLVTYIKRGIFHDLLSPVYKKRGKKTLFLLAHVDRFILDFILTGKIESKEYWLPSEHRLHAEIKPKK